MQPQVTDTQGLGDAAGTPGQASRSGVFPKADQQPLLIAFSWGFSFPGNSVTVRGRLRHAGSLVPESLMRDQEC